MTQLFPRSFSALLLIGLVACGGGGGDGDASAGGVAVQQDATANAGLERFNFWRQQIGLSAFVRHAKLDASAQGHSDYQAANRQITHYQTEGSPGFTGVCLGDSSLDPLCPTAKVSRLETADYQFTQASYAFGEVISRTSNASGADAADALIAAIYHRFVIFEPMFRDAGVGASAVAGGATYFTTNFTADGLNGGIGRGNIVAYPKQGQVNVPRNFFSDQEVPDPVPSRNEVGYPISVHADIYYSPLLEKGRPVVIDVTSFTVRPQNGSNLAVQQLWTSVDSKTPESVAAIVPLGVLLPATVYEVQFSGTLYEKQWDEENQRYELVNPVQVNRTWSFTTGS